MFFKISIPTLNIYSCTTYRSSQEQPSTETNLKTMARGNQRDLARAKNQKKQQELSKSQKKDGDPKKRMESDAEKMRQKQALGMFFRAFFTIFMAF